MLPAVHRFRPCSLPHLKPNTMRSLAFIIGPFVLQSLGLIVGCLNSPMHCSRHHTCFFTEIRSGDEPDALCSTPPVSRVRSAGFSKICLLDALICWCEHVQVEAYFFDQRRQLFEYDQVLNTQRDKVYGQRRRALQSKDLSPQMLEFAERTVDDILEVLLFGRLLFRMP
jgi:SecA Wing and Scaffold domain